MPNYLAALALLLLIGLVITRVLWLRQAGTRALHFGRLDKTDFLIPPFALFYFYGQFLVFPNWVPLIYLVAGLWLLHRQVLREETFLRQRYGREYAEYCQEVRRYV